MIGTGNATPRVFVGRDELLRPLVASICEPRTRGTVLISGYRGAGKTTLLIEALRLAAESFEKPAADGRRRYLLPLVLNVSEVAASLEQPQGPAHTLSIDPRRLWIALIRSLALYQRRTPTPFPEALKSHIEDLYIKAVAADFTRVRERVAHTPR